MITLDGLSKAVPTAHITDLAKYVDPLDEALTRYTIDTPRRIAAFIAQVAHESGDFRSTEETLNYSWQALRKTWPSHFAYASRNGNGDEASGDGWRFRGRGLIQITGRANYLAYSQAIADATVMTSPEQLALPPHAALSACWFWHEHGLSALADVGDEASFNQITLRINGGWNGKEDRLQNWAEAKTILLA
ncbi:MAG: glycoside hydrolase family 19 [Candidatus Rokuibacteriota bacterium]|nr:MAG: glycoside hydrolase family 19 [Candidatus Rokubacteria bacterium]